VTRVKLCIIIIFIKSFRRDIDTQRENLWVIELLSIEVFIKRPFYWKELFKECSMKEVEPNDDMTLAVLIQKGILTCREKVEDISRRVDKCWNIEKKLNEMLERMRLISFEV